MANFAPPPEVGFRRNPNLILPIYIVSEVHSVVAESGEVINVRRPRPPSVVSGAELVLQCDQDLLKRCVSRERLKWHCITVHLLVL
jgi:hypothetical protein